MASEYKNEDYEGEEYEGEDDDTEDPGTPPPYDKSATYNCATTLVNKLKGDMPVELPVASMYFGMNERYHNTVYGVYQGLVKYKGVTAMLIDKCWWFGRLDKLIHAKYKHHKSRYYDNFVRQKIVIGHTPLIGGQYHEKSKRKLHTYDDCEILDDDYCQNCSREGFHTSKNSISYQELSPDCKGCSIYLCRLCAVTGEDEFTMYCQKCSAGGNSIRVNISSKISRHMHYDEQHFGKRGNITVDNVIELLEIQENKCWVCNDIVQLTHWSPMCCYQFSIDRIDDYKPHNKDNCKISCYYCNCRHHSEFKQINKVCKSGCHREKRNLPSRLEFLGK